MRDVTWEQLVDAVTAMAGRSGKLRFEVAVGGVGVLDVASDTLVVQHGEHVAWEVNHGEMLSFDFGGPGGAFMVMKYDLTSARWLDAAKTSLQITMANTGVITLHAPEALLGG